jgi:peptidoglycan-associated lipoprotein
MRWRRCGRALRRGDSTSTYNQRLGMARANTVRDCLIGTGGLADGQVRAVSYGEARNRQVRPDAVGDAGRDNRRVSLVVDYAGTSSMAAPQSIPARQPAEPDSGT